MPIFPLYELLRADLRFTLRREKNASIVQYRFFGLLSLRTLYTEIGTSMGRRMFLEKIIQLFQPGRVFPWKHKFKGKLIC